MKKILTLLFAAILLLTACTENYSDGKKVGYVTKFSKKGWVCDTWEGELNQFQTGMNSASTFAFSLDRDNFSQAVCDTINSALENGWKVEITYHQVKGWNVRHNRGETDYFVKTVKIKR